MPRHRAEGREACATASNKQCFRAAVPGNMASAKPWHTAGWHGHLARASADAPARRQRHRTHWRDASATQRRGRNAFTLLEIILSLAILCGAIATLGEVSRLGMRQAERARDLTRAQLLCQSKMAEITAGLTAAESQEGVPFEATEDEPESEWLYSIEVNPASQEGLLEVRVTVTRDLPETRRPVEFSLVRWIVDESASESL